MLPDLLLGRWHLASCVLARQAKDMGDAKPAQIHLPQEFLKPQWLSCVSLMFRMSQDFT